MSGALEDRIVVAEVHRAVGEHAVLLIGSRAVGSAELSSDYDIVVALPLLLVPLRLRRLKVAAERLQLSLRVPVSVNPIPSSRLQSGRSLFVWKVRREARVLSAPRGFDLGSRRVSPVNDETVFSSFGSALSSSSACAPSAGRTRRAAGAPTRGAQGSAPSGPTPLDAPGSYCSTLDGALAASGNADLAAISACAGTGTGGFEAAHETPLFK